jgi:CheY-like chemotaxis protein
MPSRTRGRKYSPNGEIVQRPALDPDIVILDVEMPVMSGPGGFIEIRKTPEVAGHHVRR